MLPRSLCGPVHLRSGSPAAMKEQGRVRPLQSDSQVTTSCRSLEQVVFVRESHIRPTRSSEQQREVCRIVTTITKQVSPSHAATRVSAGR